MPEIQLATVLLGATEFSENNVNDTFRGQILDSEGRTRPAIIKDLDAIQLCNELLAHCIAREVGLPIPDCYLGLARHGVMRLTKAPPVSGNSRLVFASVDVKVPNVVYRWRGSNLEARKALLGEISKWGNLGHLYAYDTWIANIDRHAGNLLFGGNGEFWLIDHGHCFTGPTWSPDDLDPESEYRNRLSEWLTGELKVEQKKRHAESMRNFGAGIENFEFSDVAKNSRISNLISIQRSTALKDFLENRVPMVPLLASRALGMPTMI